ncbi:MAG: hypothetical protein E6G13_09800 [Actinobacteria bacterium]|nr:MAG: hypothetical protein E6G13_09800 [Actinomycetota bacterium]
MLARFVPWRARSLVVIALALAATAFFATAAFGDGDPQPVDFAHNVTNAPAPVAGAVFGNGPAVKTGSPICTTPTQATANVNTDCETSSAGPGPHNETSIAINPTDQRNLIGGANDYQLGLNPAGHTTESVLSRAHVTFDGGHTWTMYPVFSNSAYQATGDPSVAFDDAGHAYYATLGLRFVSTKAQNPDVLVSTSADGGKTWAVNRIAQGSGNEGSVGDLLDKEYVTAWGNGNAVVTFGDFRLAQKGAFTTAVIYSSITHDAGQTWSTPQPISAPDNQAFVSVPVHTADGRLFAAYMNTADPVEGRDTYRVVELSPATGAQIAGPFSVGLVVDGINDYPFALGSPTYHDSIFRSWAAGNITSDPTTPGHLAVVWSDMRDGPVVRADADRPGERPVDAVGCVRHAWVAARRNVRPLARRVEPRVQLLARDRDGARVARVRNGTGDDGDIGSDEDRPLVREDVESSVPVCDVVHRRLQQHRRLPERLGRRVLLDRSPKRRVVRRPHRPRRGRVLREDAVTRPQLDDQEGRSDPALFLSS